MMIGKVMKLAGRTVRRAWRWLPAQCVLVAAKADRPRIPMDNGCAAKGTVGNGLGGGCMADLLYMSVSVVWQPHRSVVNF